MWLDTKLLHLILINLNCNRNWVKSSCYGSCTIEMYRDSNIILCESVGVYWTHLLFIAHDFFFISRNWINSHFTENLIQFIFFFVHFLRSLSILVGQNDDIIFFVLFFSFWSFPTAFKMFICVSVFFFNMNYHFCPVSIRTVWIICISVF